MEEEIIQKTADRKRKLFVFAAIISAFLIYYAVMSAFGPARKLNEMKNELLSVEDEKMKEKIYSDSVYLSLLKEKSFLQSRTLMAQTDSIYLVINLSDSTSAIEISGVTVHSAKISSFDASRILMKSDGSVISNMLAMPLTTASYVASIRKEPLMIKIAPKDTSEYKPDIIPDTSVVEPVNFILEMSDGTKIYVYQEENESPSDVWSNFVFDLKDRLRNTWGSLKSIALFKIPEYHPYIKIRIPGNDAKIIFRAMPVNGQLGVYI